MKRFMLFVCLASLSWTSFAGELYRWVDSAGKVHYGDAPPREVEAEAKKFPGAVDPTVAPSYETRRAQKNFPVTLYVSENCGDYCQQGRDLLTRRGIPFTEKKLITQEEIDAFKAASGGNSLPTLVIGRTFLRGFLSIQWHNELDFAGYPKVGP